MLQACDRIDRFPWWRILSTQRYFSKAKQIDKRVSSVLIRISISLKAGVVKNLISSCDDK